MQITSFLPDIDEPKTYLTASVAAAGTALTVANNAQFAANDYIVIGKPRQEGAELHKISTVSGATTINIAGDAMDLAASINTPVTYIKYNQVKFYMGDWSTRYYTGTVAINKNSATLTGTGTTWTAITTAYALLLNGKWYDIKSVDSTTQITLTENYVDEDLESASYALVLFAVQSGSTVDIAITQEFTIWDDTDAITEDYYRSEYYNATSTAASTKSSIISAAEEEGYSEYALRSLEDQVLSDLRDVGAKRRTRPEIDRDINDGIKELINTIVSDVQEDYLNTYDTIDFNANRGEYPLFDDFRKLTAVWISYNGTDYEKATAMKISDDVPDADYDESYPMYYLRDNNMGIRPEPTAAVTAGAKVWYERRIPSLKYEGDEIPYILRDWKRALIDYALEKAFLADDQQKASIYGAAFKIAKKDMAKTLKDRDLEATKVIEAVNDSDLYL
jgi:hypothetical protein